MCSTNIVFNMKTVENSRISSFETFLEPIFSMRKSHTRHVYHAIGSAVLMCKTD